MKVKHKPTKLNSYMYICCWVHNVLSVKCVMLRFHLHIKSPHSSHRYKTICPTWNGMWLLHGNYGVIPGASLKVVTYITLDPRLLFPDSVGGMFPGPATTQKFYQGIEWFSQLVGLQCLTVLSMLITWIRGITITLTGDWHSGRLAALSPIMLRNSSDWG